MGDAAPRAENRVLIPTHGKMPRKPPSELIWDFRGETMGTSWSVRLIPPPDLGRVLFQDEIEHELAAVVALFSHWDETSELSRFNAAPEGFYGVSEPFWALLDASLDLADATYGAVDPTLGALVDLWGFGPPGPRPLDSFGKNPTAPYETEIKTAQAVSGWLKLRLNREARAVQQMGGLKLDFSGIAKGYAVDRVSDRLTALGAHSHVVEVGGEMRGAGVKWDGHPWWAELEQAPGAPAGRTVVALFDMAVATSGDWVRAYEVYGQTYSHTIDGRTGRPIANGVASVTVLAQTAMRADALATALSVMGPEEGLAFADYTGLAAAIVVRGEEGLTEIVSAAFQAMLDEGA